MRVDAKFLHTYTYTHMHSTEIMCFCLFVFCRKCIVVNSVAVQALPLVPCAMAASCRCWPTASMSPSVSCAVQPAILMACSSASPVPNNMLDIVQLQQMHHSENNIWMCKAVDARDQGL